VNKHNTSQEAVRIVCEFTINSDQGTKLLHQYLDSQTTSIETFQYAMQSLFTLYEMWNMENVATACSDYMESYINSTLYKKRNKYGNLEPSINRLDLFTSRNPVLAEHIWRTNFSTEKSREILGVALNINMKNIGGLKRAKSIGELKQYIDKRRSLDMSINDKLPPHIWTKIENAQKLVNQAKGGVRVGWSGRYINSEEIAMAENRLREAWREADKWLGKNLIQKSSKYMCN
jgi:hypothetical protein